MEKEVPEPYILASCEYGDVLVNQEITPEMEAEGYAREVTRQVQELRKKVIAHVLSHRVPVLSENSFLPHIFLGAFSSMPPLGIIDTPVRISFPIREAALVQVSPYEIIGQVPLTP